MKAVQSGLQLSGWSQRDGMGERPVRVNLPAPGQRGALQLLAQSKRELQLLKPHSTRVTKSKFKISRHVAKHYKIRHKISRKVHNLHGYCNSLSARANEITAAKKRLLEEGGGENEAQNDDDFMELETPKTVVSKKESGKTPDYPRILAKISKVVGVIIDDINKEDAFIEMLSRETAKHTQRCEDLAGEIKRQIESVAALTRSVMGTQFNRDAKTAVGRGPPGHVAFSPFTANDPLFERDDVIQVILESNRRNGKV